MRIGVPRESAALERRVAVMPDSVKALVQAGHSVTVERGAGEGAFADDAAYQAAGATVADAAAAWQAEAVLKVQAPSGAEADRLGRGQVVVALFGAARDQALLERIAARGATALALERVPRITRAQAMDVLSSQSTVAGYKAVLLGAAALPRLMPMLTTAAGTLVPARVFVLGAGVAGLQAIATARRLGGVVTAFDVRPVVKEQVESLGAKFVAAEGITAEGAGGYAKELAEEQHRRELEVIGTALKEMELVITTALIPGRPAPRLITRAMLATMKPGAVIVDLAAEAGGNCEATEAGKDVRVGGVTVLGPLNLPSSVPGHASQMFSRNLVALVRHLAPKGQLVIDLNDEITGAMALAHGGEVRHRA